MKELLIDLDSSDKLPLYEQIYRFVKREIHSGKIREGEGLPSSRALSRQLGVSRSTVDLGWKGYSNWSPSGAAGLRYEKKRRQNTSMISQ